MFKRRKSRARDTLAASGQPDGLLPASTGRLPVGIADDDLGPQATLERVRLLKLLVDQQSFAAAEELLPTVLAAPVRDECDLWTRLDAEFTLLNAIPRRDEPQEARRVDVATEIVDRFANHEDRQIRAEALLVGATLEVHDGPSAERWLRTMRTRSDFRSLARLEQVRHAMKLLERMVVEDARGRPPAPIGHDTAGLLALLRWWSEPGAALPSAVASAALPALGAVEPSVTSLIDAQEALTTATALASVGRYGDARGAICAVREYAGASGLNLAGALASIVEGDLLALVGRVADAVGPLWDGAFELRELGRLDVAAQAFIELARLGASHPELDAYLVDRVNPGEPCDPGERLLSLSYAARAICIETADRLGAWTSSLLRAGALFALGRARAAGELIDELPPPPPGRSHEFAQMELALARVRVRLDIYGTDAARAELTQAERLPAMRRAWFASQVFALQATVDAADGRLDQAWSASLRALSSARSLRFAVGDERDRSSWSASRTGIWATALDVAARRDRPADALIVIEDAKTSHLARLLRAQVASTPDLTTSQMIRDAIDRLAASGQDQDLNDRALEDAHSASQPLLRQVRLRDARLAALADAPMFSEAALMELRDAVGDFLLVDFLDLGTNALWRVTATPAGTVEARELTLSTDGAEVLARLALVGGPGELGLADADQLQAALRRLSDELFAGWPSDPAWSAQLLISPSGRLSSVPWSLLSCDGVALIERFAPMLMPSVTVGLAAPRRSPGHGPPVMLCCDPAHDLPGVAVQRDRLLEVLPDLRVFEGANATLGSLARMSHEGVLADAGGLIWAGHGLPHASEPLASGLWLGDGAIVTAGQLASLSLPSAIEFWTCSSGAERRLHFDEQLGLVAGCMRAGAPTVLVSLWPLRDADVADICAAYHRHLRAGATPQEALRRAQRASESDAAVWGALAIWGIARRGSKVGVAPTH